LNICTKCSGLGTIDGCSSCGTYNYTNHVDTKSLEESPFEIPMYYRKNIWDSLKLRIGENEHCNAILKVLDQLVTQVAKGTKVASSYAIFLPYGHGKKTAMFTIIQQYLKHGYTVAPVVDVASLAIIENNFKVNDKEAVAKWRELLSADLVCVYGVDFSARYHTMKLFLNLCSIRGLQNKPTLLFAENALSDLRSKYLIDHISEENNLRDVGCKLANPYILDGVSKSKVRT